MDSFIFQPKSLISVMQAMFSWSYNRCFVICSFTVFVAQPQLSMTHTKGTSEKHAGKPSYS